MRCGERSFNTKRYLHPQTPELIDQKALFRLSILYLEYVYAKHARKNFYWYAMQIVFSCLLHYLIFQALQSFSHLHTLTELLFILQRKTKKIFSQNCFLFIQESSYQYTTKHRWQLLCVKGKILSISIVSAAGEQVQATFCRTFIILFWSRSFLGFF